MGKRSVLGVWFVCLSRIALSLTAILMLPLAMVSAHATTYVVNDLGDEPDTHHGDGIAITAEGVTTFRAALDECGHVDGTDTIAFDSVLFSTPQTITIASTLTLLQPLNWHTTIIEGPGASLLTIDAQGSVQIMNIAVENACQVSGIRFQGGRGDMNSYEFAGAIDIGSSCQVSITSCVFYNNAADIAGGAVSAGGNSTLTIEDCAFNNNILQDTTWTSGGGAVYSEAQTATLSRCTFFGNTSVYEGAAIYASGPVEVRECVFQGNQCSRQGAIYVHYGDTLSAVNCTFADNVAGMGGGAVCSAGDSTTLVNCTLSGNQAGGMGGGVYARGPVSLYNCTLTGNEADSGISGSIYGGGIAVGSGGTVQLGNTIVAGNTDDGTTGQDVYGTVTSLGGNLIGIGDGSTGFTGTEDQVGTGGSPIDALLGPLADNGGPTQTCMPLAGSPAINAGLNELVTNPPFDGPPYYDQRGTDFPRIFDTTVDIGAVEYQAPPVITLLGEAAMTWECGTAFSDPGATALDNTNGDISANIAVTGTVDITSPGDYVLTYNVSDAAGNAAEPVTRTVTVQDTTPPIIALTGDAAVTMPCNTDYVELGATGSDACDTSLPDVSIDASTVNTDVAGTYSVTYTLTDAAGNVATPVTRTVTVEGPCAVTYHTADQDQNDLISLTELLRIIQFFNSGGFHCESGTEDGYAPGAAGDTSCAIHQSDYMPQDWKIELSELLRIIQFFNSGGYHACPDAVPATEDGYCVGPG